MRARIIQIGPWWYGQIYGKWSSFLIENTWEGWESVTRNCYTKIGARYELKKWINKNYPPEFDI